MFCCWATMLSIESSLWPLIVWMRIFGFRMGKAGSTHSLWMTLTGALMVLSTAALHFTSFVRGVFKLRANEIGTNGTNLTTANLLNIGIEHLNYTCILIGVHLSFFIISMSADWRSLWNALHLIEQHLNFRPRFYRKCRRAVNIGFFLLFLVGIYSIYQSKHCLKCTFSKDCITYLIMSISSSYWDMGPMRPVAIFLSNISRTIVLSVFLLFCVVARVVTLIFKGLNERIVLLCESEKHYPFYSTRILNVRLEKWRRNHTIACHLVRLINTSFGLVLLLTINNGFVSFITTSFEIVRSMQDNDTLPFLFVFIFVKKSILLTIMIYEPYRLQAEVFHSVFILSIIIVQVLLLFI